MSFNLTTVSKLRKLTFLANFKNQHIITQTETQKHLVMFLGTKLDFQGQLKNIQNRFNKTIGLLHNFCCTLPRLPLVIIYKSFIRADLDYGDIIYDQA